MEVLVADHGHALVFVMSMTSHFMRGRLRRFFSIISFMTGLEKSIFVMPVQPSSYLASD